MTPARSVPVDAPARALQPVFQVIFSAVKFSFTGSVSWVLARFSTSVEPLAIIRLAAGGRCRLGVVAGDVGVGGRARRRRVL